MRYVFQSNAGVCPSPDTARTIARHAKSLIYRHDRLIADIPEVSRFDVLMRTLALPSDVTKNGVDTRVHLREDVASFNQPGLFERLAAQKRALQPVSPEIQANK